MDNLKNFNTSSLIGVLNPNGFQLLRFMSNPQIRTIFLRGGSASSKSYSVAQSIVLFSFLFGGDTLVMRKVGASIENSVYKNFKMICRELLGDGNYEARVNEIRIPSTGAQISFTGLDDPEKLKSISGYSRIFMEEVTEFDLEDYKQVKKRLRGKPNQKIICAYNPISEDHWIKKEIRDKEQWNDVQMWRPFSINFGTDIGKGGLDFDLPECMMQVKSLMCNSSHEIYNPVTRKIEKHKPDTIEIVSTYLNNFWIVGAPEGYHDQGWGNVDMQVIADMQKDKASDPAYYQVYGLGDFGQIKTGSEFLPSFKIGRNTGEIAYNDKLPIHATIDNNVLPYITCTLWQILYDDNTNLCQFGEILARPPQNSAKKSARMLADYLHSIHYSGTLYLHCDASTKAKNTIDDDKRSWYDLYSDTLKDNGIEVEDRSARQNPNVVMRGEFVNAIFDEQVPEVRVVIGEHCRESIADYQRVQKDMNGGMLKQRSKDKETGLFYEKCGHLADCMGYIVTDIFGEEFIDFCNGRKRNMFGEKDSIKFFNPHLKYSYDARVIFLNPNVKGYVIMFVAERVSGLEIWHIRHAVYCTMEGVEEIKRKVKELHDEHEERDTDFVLVECGHAYYDMVNELREMEYDVRVKGIAKNSEQITAALSDYVKNTFYFDAEKKQDEREYGDFIMELHDYNKDTSYQTNCVSCLSSFAHLVIKTMQD